MLAIEVSAGIGAFIVNAAAAAGVSRAALEKRTGFTLSRADDPDARIPIEMETALWEEAASATGDSAFGLHAAEGLRPGVFDVLDYVVRAAPTLRASFERLARYNRLVHDAAVFVVGEGRSGGVRIEHSLSRPGVVQSRHAAEFTLASLVVVGAQMSAAPLAPVAVELRHPAPDAAARAAHLRLFGIAPRYDRAVNALELTGEAAARPVRTADPLLSRVVVRHAEALLAERPAATETTAGSVRRILTRLLGDDEAGCSLAAVSASLHMSERSLQRRLADEGVTFDALLDELRRELALRYLADEKVAIAEIAYLLGYSEPSAFHRAFKRWTGTTPAEARQRRRHEGAG
ncbi:MAG TPA: AraC family transcriptional regulator [Polyangia bacterium]|nr:AraC family transcriptional regulator [Polyangia bacterium]